MEHKTGLEDYYVIRGQKKMRFGYTTGSCAAAACKGACLMLLGKEKLTSVPLMTPKGILLDLELHDIQISENQVTCAVKKDAGDDPDTTNGILVYATVWKTDTAGIVIDGGPRSRITLKSSSSYNVADGISPFAILQKIQSLIVLSSQIEYINYTSDNSENHIFFQNFLKNFWNSIFYFCRIISIF